MAGKRQHYIPRFLLKKFSSRSHKQKYFAWYFYKGSKPEEVSIRDIGLSKHFYSKAEPGSLDDIITKREGEYDKVITLIKEKKIKKQEKKVN